MKGSVLIVSNLYPPHVVGGAELVAHRQAVQLARRGWNVEVFSGRFADSPETVGTLELDEWDGLPVYRLSHFSLEPEHNFRWDKANRYLMSLIARDRPSWVHFHNVTGLGAELIRVAKRSGARVAVTLHDHWGVCFKNTLLRNDHSLCHHFEWCATCKRSITPRDGLTLPMRFRRDYVAFCLGHADQLISPSRSLASVYRTSGVSEERLKVISNGLDLQNIPSGRREAVEKTSFLVSSYLGEHKGILILLEALRLLTKVPDLAGKWEIAIAGDGHLEKTVKAFAEEPAVQGCVAVLGRLPRTELLPRLRQSHVVILASVWPENEPVSLLEAIASGAAIIATDIGGNRDILNDYSAGVTCAPGDPADLARAMESLIRDPLRIEALSSNNLAQASALDEQRAIDRIEAVYAETNTPVHDDERIVICAGGQPDEQTYSMIEALSGDVRNRSIRLVWIEWADPDVWERASGFWWWGKTGGSRELNQAARRGIPICARVGVESMKLKRSVPIHVYNEDFDLSDWLVQLSSPAKKSKFRLNPVLQRVDQLRARDDFNLSVEG